MGNRRPRRVLRAPRPWHEVTSEPFDLDLVLRGTLQTTAFSETGAPPLVRTRVRLPWWVRLPGLRQEMEKGLASARLKPIAREEIDDNPLLRAVRRVRSLWSVRGYRFLAEGAFGRMRLVILVSARAPDDAVVVCLDGPAGADVASPHRNAEEGPRGHELCLFYPGDPEARRWLPRDGLVALADLARAHLYREHVWRLEGYWPGEEAPHGEQERAA